MKIAQCWLRRQNEMEKEGKYIYCIIEAKQERNFGPVGLGGRGDEVLTIGYEDLSMVVSDHPMARLTANRENMLSHQRAIETVMKEFDSVLPVRFGTVASGLDEIRNLLDRRYREFKNALLDMDRKVELGVKGLWKKMDVIFNEIVEENETIKTSKEALKKENNANIQTKMNIGMLVKNALQDKKEKQAEEIVDRLKRTSCEYKLNSTYGDQMFLNAAFLISKGREKEFDNIMNELSDEHEDRIRFIYAGPLPVFNFVNIVIYPEEWEK